MDWLNYHHLLYFWTVAREGSIARASESLGVSQPAVSMQIKRLEKSLGERLFVRQGRRLVLTEMGRHAMGYADGIFTLGRELVDSVKRRVTGGPVRLSVGIADGVPKLVARSILEPSLALPSAVQLVCRQDRVEALVAELAAFRLDLVIADTPMPTGSPVKGFSHPLGDSGVSFFASPALARRLCKGFPRSLDRAPVFLPTENTSLRRSLDAWMHRLDIRPVVLGEFEDSALLKTFGQAGAAAFPAPTVVEADVARQYNVRPVGVAEGVRERFWVLSIERRLKNPAVVAITDTARDGLFADG